MKRLVLFLCVAMMSMNFTSCIVHRHRPPRPPHSERPAPPPPHRHKPPKHHHKPPRPPKPPRDHGRW